MMEQSGVLLLDEDGRMRVRLEGSARVETAVLLQQKLMQTQIANDVVIDWAEVEHVDACVLQVLLALGKLLTARGLTLVVEKDNAKVRRFLKLSGMSEYFPVRDESHLVPSAGGGDA